MAHKFESGDEFKIDPKYLGRRCNAKNKTYIIHHINKYGNLVYYRDNRTNVKCTCSQCRPINSWGAAPIMLFKSGKKLSRLGKLELVNFKCKKIIKKIWRVLKLSLYL